LVLARFEHPAWWPKEAVVAPLPVQGGVAGVPWAVWRPSWGAGDPGSRTHCRRRASASRRAAIVQQRSAA
jgi:hypothetical protein